MKWENVVTADGTNGVQRITVIGGWLYRTEVATRICPGEFGAAETWTYSWSDPVFVADTRR